MVSLFFFFGVFIFLSFLHFFPVSFLSGFSPVPFSEPWYHLALCLSFAFCPFSSALIYGGWRAAGVGSYDVWLQRLFLSALIWQSCCCP